MFIRGRSCNLTDCINRLRGCGIRSYVRVCSNWRPFLITHTHTPIAFSSIARYPSSIQIMKSTNAIGNHNYKMIFCWVYCRCRRWYGLQFAEIVWGSQPSTFRSDNVNHEKPTGNMSWTDSVENISLDSKTFAHPGNVSGDNIVVHRRKWKITFCAGRLPSNIYMKTTLYKPFARKWYTQQWHTDAQYVAAQKTLVTHSCILLSFSSCVATFVTFQLLNDAIYEIISLECKHFLFRMLESTRNAMAMQTCEWHGIFSLFPCVPGCCWVPPTRISHSKRNNFRLGLCKMASSLSGTIDVRFIEMICELMAFIHYRATSRTAPFISTSTFPLHRCSI